MQKHLIIYLVLMLFVHRVNAETQSLASTFTQSIASDMLEQTSQELATQWGITSDEWKRYQQLMQGPLGIYSPHIDPLTALGIEAQNKDKRRYYAELQVKAEAKRVEKELAYQRAYDEAWQRLYPTLLPIADLKKHITPLNYSPAASPRLAVFVKTHCSRCEQIVKKLQADNQRFDIYLLDSQQDDTLVRRWATQVGIDLNKVKDKHITLNHDAGKWQKLGVMGDFPAVVKEVNGRWQRIE